MISGETNFAFMVFLRCLANGVPTLLTLCFRTATPRSRSLPGVPDFAFSETARTPRRPSGARTGGHLPAPVEPQSGPPSLRHSIQGHVPAHRSASSRLWYDRNCANTFERGGASVLSRHRIVRP